VSDDDGTVVVVNEDDEAHQVTVTLDRGSGYDTPTGSLSLDAGERGQIRSFISESDWNYPLLLHVEIDGEYVESTRHLGFDDVTLRITSTVGVENVDPDDGPTVTPSDPHGPPTDA